MATHSFLALGLNDKLLEALAHLGFESPSPIQAQCIPALLKGADVLGIAQTGTGKTAAFALPILEKIDLSSNAPQALILTPTRELALQVSESFQSYAVYLKNFQVLPLYGGQSYAVQFKQLKRGAQVIVATPGRLIDHLERKTLDLSAIQSVVLDEADEMLRMGFIEEVQKILDLLPPNHQTALFSATMPQAIRRVAENYLKEPVEIRIKSKTATVEAIHQSFWQVSGLHKLDALTRILEVEEDLDAAIIFVRTKTQTVELADKLQARGFAAAALNGDLNQMMRERTIEQLKNGALDIVIATDVAARGLDVARISHVINYDIPYDSESYVHRIGRTGRAGRAGHAILFVSPREMRMLKTIERTTKANLEPLALPTRADVLSRRVNDFKERILATREKEDLSFFQNLIKELTLEKDELPSIAAALAFMAQEGRPLLLWNEEKAEKAEKTQKKLKKSVKKSADFEKKSSFTVDKQKNNKKSEFFDNDEWLTFRLEVGKSHGVKAGDIVGAIANESGVSSQNIGHIRLKSEFSLVELPEKLAGKIAKKLAKTRIKGLPISLKKV